mgnify:CR=1 FL=1
MAYQMGIVELGWGLKQSADYWKSVLSSLTYERTLVLTKIMGGMTMFSLIEAIFYNVTMQFGPSIHMDVLIGVRLYMEGNRFHDF